MYFIYGISFVLGTLLGSFLNVLADRLPRGENPWSGRSRCDHCGKTLTTLDLVPIVSYLISGGRCRYCHKKLSLYYPLIELGSGLLFLFLTRYVWSPSLFSFTTFLDSHWIMFVRWLSLVVIFSSFLVIFVADLKYQIIPDELLVSSILGSLLYTIASSPFSHISIYEKIIAAVFAGGLFEALYLLTKGKGMGMGDVKLALVLGLFLGFPSIIIAIYGAFLTGAFVSIILLASRKKRLKEKIAFGPFLIIGGVTSFFYSEELISLFFQFLR